MPDPLAARVLPVPPEDLFLTVKCVEGLFLTVESAGRPGKTGAETGKLWTFAENMI